MDQRIIDRYWEKVRKGPDCWGWEGTTRGGYGIFGMRLDGVLKSYSAHRVSFEIANGPFDSLLHVLHRCDNRPCTNPEHLFLGTHQDNMDDMYAKGRRERAKEKVPVSVEDRKRKLSLASIREIEEALKNPYWGLGNHLARKYGVDHTTISLIRHGKYPNSTPVSSD